MQKIYHTLKNKNLLQVITLFLLVVSLVSTSVHAATIGLSPSSLELASGQTQVFRVLVNTQSVAINAAEGVISFDPTTTEILSINKAGSVLNLWIEEPSFSNATGKVSFNGGAVTPGYTGSAGHLFSITVRAKKAGGAGFTFQDVSIRQNDGAGTNVLTGQTNSTVSVTSSPKTTTATTTKTVLTPTATVTPVAKTTTNSSVLPKPVLSSKTHVDQNAWYATRNLVVSWPVNNQATGVQTLFNSISDSAASGPIQYGLSKTLQGVRDGISYLHVRYLNNNSTGETAHFAIHIDTIAPTSLDIEATSTGIQITGVDEQSGIAYADVSIDGAGPERLTATNGVVLYQLQDGISSGIHEVVVDVFDKAGNSLNGRKMLDLSNIKKVSLSVANKSIYLGEEIVITGKVTPRTEVVSVFVKYPNQKVETFLGDTDQLGEFIVNFPTNEEGIYSIWSSADGASKTEVIEVAVQSQTRHKILAWVQTHGLLFLSGLLLLLAGALAGQIRGRKQNGMSLKEVHKLEEETEKSLKILKHDARSQILYLDRIAAIRLLTKEEKATYTKCQDLLK